MVFNNGCVYLFWISCLFIGEKIWNYMYVVLLFLFKVGDFEKKFVVIKSCFLDID